MDNLIENQNVKYGIICGVVSVLFSLVAYFLDITLMSTWWYGLIILVISVIIAITGTKARREQIGGFMNYGQALLSLLVIFIISMLVATVFNILLHVFDPTLADQLKEQTIETTVSMLEKFNTPQEVIDEQLEKLNEQDFGMTPLNIAKQFVGAMVFYLIISLIAAIFLKKERSIFSQPDND